MKYDELIQLYFERSNALQAYWTLYVVIVGGMLAFSSMRKLPAAVTTLIVTLLFGLFASSGTAPAYRITAVITALALASPALAVLWRRLRQGVLVAAPDDARFGAWTPVVRTAPPESSSAVSRAPSGVSASSVRLTWLNKSSEAFTEFKLVIFDIATVCGSRGRLLVPGNPANKILR